MSGSIYKRIDHAVYQAERAVVVGALVLMSLVVFLDVVHRSFSGDESKLAQMVAKVAGWVGMEIPAGSSAHAQLAAAAPTVLFVGFSALTYFGIRSTKRATPIAAPIAAVAAVAGVVVSYGLVRLLLVLVPNGLTWSQDVALVLTLWVGFVGASMCTYENRHLRVEAVQRFLPASIRPLVGLLSGLFTTVVCLGLFWVSVRYVAFHYQEYVDTKGQGGLFPGMSLPKYVGFGALPLAFGFMAVRFFVKALGALRGELEVPLEPLVAAVVPRSDGVPSQVPTEARLRSRSWESKESSIDTMTSKVERVMRDAAVPRPQSKVPTDAHDVIPPLAGFEEPEEPEESLDPDRTKELDEGPIELTDDTQDLRSDELTPDAVGTASAEEERR